MGFSMGSQIQILGRMASGEDAPKAPALTYGVREESGSGGSFEAGGVPAVGGPSLRHGRGGLQGVPRGQGRLGRQGQQMAAEGAAIAIVMLGVVPVAGHAGGLGCGGDGGGFFLRSGGLGLRLMAVIMRPMGHGAGGGQDRSQHQKANEDQATQHGETI